MKLHVGLFHSGRVLTKPYDNARGKGQDAAALDIIFHDLLANARPRVRSFNVTGSFTRQFMRGA